MTAGAPLPAEALAGLGSAELDLEYAKFLRVGMHRNPHPEDLLETLLEWREPPRDSIAWLEALIEAREAAERREPSP